MGVFRSYREAPASRRAFRLRTIVTMLKTVKVEKNAFEAMMAKMIATPASAKDGIKPKPSARKRPRARPSRSTPHT